MSVTFGGNAATAPYTHLPNLQAVVEYRGIGLSADTLFSFTTGIDPTPTGALPALVVEGSNKPLDVFPHSYNPDGDVVSISAWGLAPDPDNDSYKHVAILAPPPSMAPLTPLKDVIAGTPGNYADLSALEVVISAIDGKFGAVKDHKTFVASGTETELKSGQYIYKRRFFSRLKANPAAGGTPEDKDDYSLGLTTDITYRQDKTVTLDVVLHNDIYNATQPTRTLSFFHFDRNHHPELNGTMHFLSIELKGVPTGYSISSVVDDPSMDTGGTPSWFVKPETNGLTAGSAYPAFVQRIWPRQRILRRYVLVPENIDSNNVDLNKAVGRKVAQFRGHGAAIGGPLANFQRDWWGGGATPPEFTESYQVTAEGVNLTGRSAVQAFAKAYKSTLTSALVFSQRGADFMATTQNHGWWRGIADESAVNGGSPLIHFWDGLTQVDDHLCALWIRMSYQVQRHTTGLVEPSDGSLVTPAKLVEANDIMTVPGTKELPFSESRLDFAAYDGCFPWFILPDETDLHSNPWTFTYNSMLGLDPFLDFSGSGGTQNVGAPDDRAWNTPAAASELLQGNDVYQYSSIYHWGTGPGTHEPRLTSGSEALSFACDLDIAKWFVAQQSHHVRTVMAITTSTASARPDQRNGQSLKAGLDIFQNNTSRARQGGLKVDAFPNTTGGGVIDWGRGSGHQIACVGYHASLVPHEDGAGSPTAEHLALKEWSEWVVRLTDWVATKWGATARRSMNKVEIGRGYSCDYGPMNLAQKFGSREWDGSSDPNDLDAPGLGYQVFQAAIVQRGIFALEHALAPRVPTNDPDRPPMPFPATDPRVVTDAPHLRLIDSLTESMWQAMDQWYEENQGNLPSVRVDAFHPAPGLMGSQSRHDLDLLPDPHNRPLAAVHTVAPINSPVASLATADAEDSQVVWALPGPRPAPFVFNPGTGNINLTYSFDQSPACTTTNPNTGVPSVILAIPYPAVANDRCLIMPWASHSVALEQGRGQVPDFLRWMRRQAQSTEFVPIPAMIRNLLDAGSQKLDVSGGHNRSERIQFLAAAGDMQRKFRAGLLFPTAQTAGLHTSLTVADLTPHAGGALNPNQDSFEKLIFTSPVTFSHAVEFRDCVFEGGSPTVGKAVEQIPLAGNSPLAQFTRCEFLNWLVQADVRNADFYSCRFEGAGQFAVLSNDIVARSTIRECYFGALAATASAAISIKQSGAGATLFVTDSVVDIGAPPNPNVVGLQLDASVGSVVSVVLIGNYLNGGRVCIEIPIPSVPNVVSELYIQDNHFGRQDVDGLIDKTGLTGAYDASRNVFGDNGENADDEL